MIKTKEQILDSIVRDWATPITRQEAYEAMQEYADQFKTEEPQPSHIEKANDIIENLLEAIPKQTEDADWWEDNLTDAVHNAKTFLSETEGKDKINNYWQERCERAEYFLDIDPLYLSKIDKEIFDNYQSLKQKVL